MLLRNILDSYLIIRLIPRNIFESVPVTSTPSSDLTSRRSRDQCFATSVTAAHGDHRDPFRRCTPQMYEQH